MRIVARPNLETHVSRGSITESICVPLGEDTSLAEPRCSSVLMDFRRNVVVG